MHLNMRCNITVCSYEGILQTFRINSPSSAASIAHTGGVNIKHVILQLFTAAGILQELWHDLVVLTVICWNTHSYIASAANNWYK